MIMHISVTGIEIIEYISINHSVNHKLHPIPTPNARELLDIFCEELGDN